MCQPASSSATEHVQNRPPALHVRSEYARDVHRDELVQIPEGGKYNFNHLFFFYAELHHPPGCFCCLLSLLFALCCPSAIKASTASREDFQGAATTPCDISVIETSLLSGWESVSMLNSTWKLSSLSSLYLPTPVRVLCFQPCWGWSSAAIFRSHNICHFFHPASSARDSFHLVFLILTIKDAKIMGAVQYSWSQTPSITLVSCTGSRSLCVRVRSCMDFGLDVHRRVCLS